MVARARDYSLVHDVVALAPSFGRTRGAIRGAAGYTLVWPASRTRASVVEARVAEVAARRAWKASELSLELLRVDCERLRRFADDMEELRVLLVRVRRLDAAARARGTRVKDEHGRGNVAQTVADVAAALAAWLVVARARLDRFYWGVWGSARRVKASARELDVLDEATRDAEHGDWYADLPGGSNWLAAAAAAMVEGEQLSGGGETGGRGGCSAVAVQGGDSDSDSGGNGGEPAVEADVDGWRAADGGHAGLGWRGGDGGDPWRLHTRQSSCLRLDEARWSDVVLQMMASRFGELLGEGDGEGPAACACRPGRKRLWWAWKFRRRRRLRSW